MGNFWKEVGNFFGGDAASGGIDFLDWWNSPDEIDAMNKPAADYEKAKEDLADVNTGTPIYDDNGRITGVDYGDGNIVSYDSLWSQLDEAKAQGIPDLNTWMDQQNGGTGYDFYDPMARDGNNQFVDQTMQDMQALIDQLTTGPTAMELGAAQDYASRLMGIDPAEYQTIVGGLLQTSTADIDSLQGLSDEERALRERSNRNELRAMEETASRLLDNIAASTGSTSRAYAAADQALGQINDAQIQQSMVIADEDYRRKVNLSESAERQWAAMVQAGQMGSAQYLDLLQQSKSMAFQGYAVQVNTMMQQNQQYLQQYQADTMAIEANINNIYKAIQMEIGINDKAMSDLERQYQLEMAPILTAMDIAVQDIAMAEANASTFDIGQFLLGTALVVGGALLAIPTGGASVAGAAAIAASTGLITAGAGTVVGSF